MSFLQTVIGVSCLLFLLAGCQEASPVFVASEAEPTILGMWEQRSFFEGTDDTSITFYHFISEHEFEFGSWSVHNGNRSDTVYNGGQYLEPVSGLLILNYFYSRRSGITEHYPVRGDTFVYKNENFYDLVMCGLIRKYRRLSGPAGKLRNSEFYNVERHANRFAHSRYVFKSDSLYFYSLFSDNAEMPAVWGPPFKFRVSIFGTTITYFYEDGRTASNGYVLYESDLIMTYDQQTYRFRP